MDVGAGVNRRRVGVVLPSRSERAVGEFWHLGMGDSDGRHAGAFFHRHGGISVCGDVLVICLREAKRPVKM